MTPGSARPWVRAGLVTALVIAADQVVKALVRADIQRGESVDIIPGALRLVHVHNEGVAFGALAGTGLVVTVVIALALVALVGYFATHLELPLAWLPTGMLLGGAVGNIVDRIRAGSVTDFIKFPSWPAFNVADVCITLGVIILLVVIERGERHRRHAVAPES